MHPLPAAAAAAAVPRPKARTALVILGVVEVVAHLVEIVLMRVALARRHPLVVVVVVAVAAVLLPLRRRSVAISAIVVVAITRLLIVIAVIVVAAAKRIGQAERKIRDPSLEMHSPSQPLTSFAASGRAVPRTWSWAVGRSSSTCPAGPSP